MKILMISMFSPHFFNWTEQLRGSGHDIYWLDVFDSNIHVEKIDFVNQITGWRYKCDYPGRYFLKKKAPTITKIINRWNEREFTDILVKKIEEIKPDVVHSFVMYLSTVPILPVMEKHPELKWIFSSWGSDLFYYSQKENYLNGIKRAMPKLDYMFADCERDYQIAINYGFKGKFLGVFPGGGGFDFGNTDALMQPLNERNNILIKGYQGLHGKCIEVLKSLQSLKEQLLNYEIVIFGANQEVQDYYNTSEINNWKNLKILSPISHRRVMKLMGKSIIYIGNSTSDGIPNTLLEAITMEAFPIQSNPGEATAEIIQNGKNGFLIENPENVKEIANLIQTAIERPDLLKSGIVYNTKYIKPKLEREQIKKHVLEKYSLIENELKN